MPGSSVTEEVKLHDVDRGGDVPRGDDGGGSRPGGETPRSAYFTGLFVGLAAILMFFMALTSAFIVRKGLGGDWRAIALPPVLWFNTLVLVVSSVTLERARRQLARDLPEDFRRWWGVSTALGILFLAGQLVAWSQLAAAGVYLASNPSSSFFYLLTAAHGLHLLGGLAALGYVARRTLERLRRSRGLAADLAATYWHFMDGLWVFLMLLFYLGR